MLHLKIKSSLDPLFFQWPPEGTTTFAEAKNPVVKPFLVKFVLGGSNIAGQKMNTTSKFPFFSMSFYYIYFLLFLFISYKSISNT